MAEMKVNAQLVDALGHEVKINADGTLAIRIGLDGSFGYSALIYDAPGVVAANNFLSIFNPVGSGKNVSMGLFRASAWASASTIVAVSMAVWRITAASGGTLLAPSNVNKFDSTTPNSIVEVRTGNPTCTLSGTVPITTVAPAISASGVGASTIADVSPPGNIPFILRPGEGLVARTDSGDTGQMWNLGFSWAERAING